VVLDVVLNYPYAIGAPLGQLRHRIDWRSRMQSAGTAIRMQSVPLLELEEETGGAL
jgi:hypothetical protein